MTTTRKTKAKPKRPAASPKEVVVIKRDAAAGTGERLKTGVLILFAGTAAAGTVYLFGSELRTLLGDLLLWSATQIASLL